MDEHRSRATSSRRLSWPKRIWVKSCCSNSTPDTAATSPLIARRASSACSLMDLRVKVGSCAVVKGY